MTIIYITKNKILPRSDISIHTSDMLDIFVWCDKMYIEDHVIDMYTGSEYNGRIIFNDDDRLFFEDHMTGEIIESKTIPIGWLD